LHEKFHIDSGNLIDNPGAVPMTNDERLKEKLGENPTRLRHCKRRILLENHWGTGKVRRVMTLKPGNLPVFVHHELYV